ncbi:MAG: exo-beta-N-acetylmuramidase NamZ domain-containing protein, partial [Balneolales bacterium]
MRFILPLFCSGFFVILMAVTACSETNPTLEQKVTVGAEVLLRDHLDDLEGRRVGLVMNPTARISDTHVLDTLLRLSVDIQALYAPEHGFRGDRGAGEKIEGGFDQESGLPVFSLYGESRKPTPDMLEHVDLLLFDMQDVGARFYTYISTMGLVMEAAADNGVEVWILDRPNPAGGEYVSG